MAIAPKREVLEDVSYGEDHSMLGWGGYYLGVQEEFCHVRGKLVVRDHGVHVLLEEIILSLHLDIPERINLHLELLVGIIYHISDFVRDRPW